MRGGPLYYLLQCLTLANIVLGGQFRFDISEIFVNSTLDVSEDDLLLVVVSNVETTSTNKTWSLGSVEVNYTIKWTNLTHEFETPDSQTNMSVAFGVANAPDADEQGTADFVGGVASIASFVPGPVGIIGGLVDFFTGLTDCSGPVAADNIVYAAKTLKNMTKNQRDCDTKTYNASKEGLNVCEDALYTITYCLERLDAETPNAATTLASGSLLIFLGLAISMLL